MKTLGISLFSGGFQYAIIEKNGDCVSLLERNKCVNPAGDRLRESSEWFYGSLEEICQNHDISKAGFKTHYKLMKVDDLYAHGAPIGVLGYFCSNQNIPVEGYTVRKIKSYKFLKLPRGTDSFNWVKTNKNDGNPYWSNEAVYAVAIALHRGLDNE